jgi:ATP-binding cassette subfamily G (WHITE) protein 2 (SNQ2)
VVQGATTDKVDWVGVWNNSDERKQALQELEALNEAGRADPKSAEDTADYATSLWFQFMMVAKRLTIQIWRSPVRRVNDALLK